MPHTAISRYENSPQRRPELFPAPRVLADRRPVRCRFLVLSSGAPAVTPSMRAALADLALDRLDVVHAGPATFPLADRIRAVAAADLLAIVGQPRRTR